MSLNASPAPARVAIVGGGASGVITAAHLLRRARGPLEIHLIERSGAIGRGVAYSTADAGHLLNVPAGNMSALADEPDHFVRWLSVRESLAPETARAIFAPRRLYGAYLGGLLDGAPAGAVRRVADECVRLRECADGVRLDLRSGAYLVADVAVLATGHDLPAARVGGLAVTDPHDASAIAAIGADQAVIIAGTGLTMVDTVVTLAGQGHRGPITAISRRGLLPQPHRPGACRPLAPVAPPRGAPISELMRWLRAGVAAQATGEDWRSAVDALRPHTQGLWRSMSADQRRRFLRHGRAWWDVRRHRMAPEIAGAVQRLRAEGRLRVIAGRIDAARRTARGVAIDYRPRGGSAVETLSAEHVIACVGSPDGPSRSADPLVRALIAGRLARPDALDLGLDIAADGAVIDAAGAASERLFAVGPITRAAFWETIAVPDIRAQCAALAETLAAAMDPRTAGKARRLAA